MNKLRRSQAFFLIAVLFIFAAIGAYLITGKPQPVGEIAGKVIAVTTVSAETDAKAEILIELMDGGFGLLSGGICAPMLARCFSSRNTGRKNETFAAFRLKRL